MCSAPQAGPDRLSEDIEATLARCHSTVRSVAAGMGLAEADVDAVFQDVRIRLWKALRSGDRVADVSASYVYRAARSAALDLIRARRADHVSSDEPGVPPLRLVADGDPQTDLERRDLAARVNEAVDDLAENRRPVVRMYLTGYRLREIAELLGWTEGKTRNLLYRGLDDLRATLRARGIHVGDAG